MVSSAKLASAHAAKTAVGQILVIPWLIFSATANPVSNRPAARMITQAIVFSPLSQLCLLDKARARNRGVPPMEPRWRPPDSKATGQHRYDRRAARKASDGGCCAAKNDPSWHPGPNDTTAPAGSSLASALTPGKNGSA